MKRLILSTFIATAMLMSAAPLVLAQSGSSQGSLPTGNAPGGTTKTSFELVNPLGIKNFCDLAKKLLDIIISLAVPVAILFLVWAGFKFILARGNPTELGVARKNFMYVIIGIAVFLGAWTLASVISATIKTLDSSGTVQFCGR